MKSSLFDRWILPASSALALLFLSAGSVMAQPAPTPPANPPPAAGVGGNLTSFIFKKAPYEFWLTCLIILFGLTVVALYIYAIRNIQNRKPEDVSRALIVITVITGSLILITAGYSNDQIAPAFGLFGTVIGYMLGRMSSTPPSDGKQEDAK